MSEPIGITSKSDGGYVTWHKPPRLRCKQGHEVEDDDALKLTITGTTPIRVGPTCPLCIAAYLREHFGMEPVNAAKELADGE